MKPRDVVAMLADLQHTVNRQIDRLNHGGCGLFAVEVGARLKKLGLEVEIVTPYDRHGEYFKPPHKVRKILKSTPPLSKSLEAWDWDHYGLDRTHLGVRFRMGGRLYVYDSSYLYRAGTVLAEGHSLHYRFGNGLTLREAREFNKQHKAWNRSFDRDQIPKLKRLVKEAFATIS